MRKIIFFLVIIFSLQSWTKADSISDFQIERISIGDSLLSHISKEEINKIKSPNKKLKIVRTRIKDNLDQYKYVQLWWFDQDIEYRIVGISGELIFDNDLEGCKKKQKEIANSVKKTLKDFNIKQSQNNYSDDLSGNSKVYHHAFKFENGDNINVQCYMFSKNYKEKNNLIDNLKVMIVTKEMDEHFREAYK